MLRYEFTALAMIPMKEGTKMLIVMSVGTTPLLSSLTTIIQCHRIVLDQWDTAQNHVYRWSMKKI